MASNAPRAVADAVAALAAENQAPHFLVVYASIVNGRSWCGDCIRAEPLIQEKFPAGEQSRLTVQYAGDKETWRSPENEWRKFGVPALPTLYKVTPDGTWSQLVEGEVYDKKKLDAFVGTQ
ncbi:hypothetical protein N8I77_005400 [Diaporthe amygdali]|uniref:Thioredoxin domain-containing protein n=1 Tax=Phomopsis amygdali TaxID=1214568 RepID=A0AAD9W2W6_PHOAM|nr:hypothetical protein N8I77_005400 [Diaporthe amygdali]